MFTPEYSISTPENVELRLELAGLGNRMLAAGIDTLILLVVLVSIFITFAFAAWCCRASMDASSFATFSAYFLMVTITLSLVIPFGYFIFFEGLWHGQTPGKKIAHIRVIDQAGQPIGWTASFVRNLIRIVDQQVMMIGVLSMLLDKNERRLGDFAAGTLVIRERMPEVFSDTQLNEKQPSALVDVGRIAPEEYNLLVTYFKRRAKLSAPARQSLAKRLDEHFRPKLGLDGDARSPETLLEDVYLTYRS
jgi:uncharacterized RDD family membrane protein YckC